MTVTRGLPGMKLNYVQAIKCIVSMDDYVRKTQEDAPADMDGLEEIPAADHLFVVDKGAWGV